MTSAIHLVHLSLHAIVGIDGRNPFAWCNVGHANARWGLVSAFGRTR